MPDPASHAELLRALGRMVRGLSALFWGLPLALVIGVQTARTDWLRPFGVVPLVVACGLLLYGLRQLGSFQKQERVWRTALDRAQYLATANLGLAPFLYWWCQVPEVRLFRWMAMLLAMTSLLFLGCVNLVLRRLGAMLPDETLRHEIRLFTTANLYFLLAILICAGSVFVALPLNTFHLAETGASWLVLLMVLLPLAMTMALIWKTKEVISASVFGPDHGQLGMK